ncbi:MAG: hypothetical protein GYA39_06250 [Methanothrix sp.]|nr:hypothetical protein [Methanothrix sp.]
MKKEFSFLVGAILIALVAQAAAESPSDVVNLNRKAAYQPPNTSIINPMDPGYVWGNPLAIGLSGINPLVFESAVFKKDPGGLTLGSLYTTSIDNFLKADPEAGASNVTKKTAKIGLVNWPK